jgi:hypothetical protein
MFEPVPPGIELRDVQGNTYPVKYESLYFDPETKMISLSFTEVPPSVMELTLQVTALNFSLPTDDASFEIDLGDSPQLDNEWPLEIDEEFAGFPIYIPPGKARLIEGAYHSSADIQATLLLEFGPFEVNNGLVLSGLDIDLAWLASQYGFDDSGGGGGGGSGMDESGKVIKEYSIALGIPHQSPLPSGLIEVRLLSISLEIYGPYSLSWEVTHIEDSNPETEVTINGMTCPAASDSPEQIACDLITALVTRDSSQLTEIMADPLTFMFPGQGGGGGRTFTPEELLAEFYQSYFPTDTNLNGLMFTTDMTRCEQCPFMAAQLPGPPGTIGDVALAIYSEGWGQDGLGVAMLYITQNEVGEYVWDGMVFSPKSFDK